MFYITINILKGVFLSTLLSTSALTLYCVSAGLNAALLSGAFFWLIKQIRETSEIRVIPMRRASGRASD